MNTKKIGFIGGGNMATSLITGLTQSGHPPSQIWVSDINQNALNSLAERLGVNITSDNNLVASTCDVIVLAVKPQVMNVVVEPMKSTVQQHLPLVISIAAGITQQMLSAFLGQQTAVVRCMPNTPALVLSGATALHANPLVDAPQQDLAENILRAVGLCIWVENESEMDAVTAVSGSGPAYYFLMMEAMEKAGVELGLSADTSRLLVQQTALGAAKIALESDDAPVTLRERVTSPGGTTQQAITTFQQSGFVQLVSKAMHAAHDRSIEMSNELGGK